MKAWEIVSSTSKQPAVWSYCRATTFGKQVQNIAEAETAISQAFIKTYAPAGFRFGGWFRDDCSSGITPWIDRKSGKLLWAQHLSAKDVVLSLNMQTFCASIADLENTIDRFAYDGFGLALIDAKAAWPGESGDDYLANLRAYDAFTASLRNFNGKYAKYVMREAGYCTPREVPELFDRGTAKKCAVDGRMYYRIRANKEKLAVGKIVYEMATHPIGDVVAYLRTHKIKNIWSSGKWSVSLVAKTISAYEEVPDVMREMRRFIEKEPSDKGESNAGIEPQAGAVDHHQQEHQGGSHGGTRAASAAVDHRTG